MFTFQRLKIQSCYLCWKYVNGSTPRVNMLKKKKGAVSLLVWSVFTNYLLPVRDAEQSRTVIILLKPLLLQIACKWIFKGFSVPFARASKQTFMEKTVFPPILEVPCRCAFLVFKAYFDAFIIEIFLKPVCLISNPSCTVYELCDHKQVTCAFLLSSVKWE